MALEQILSAVWRRRVLFSVVFAISLGAVAVTTFLLPPTYKATATVFFGLPKGDAAVDPNTGEQLTRTFAAIASNPNLADVVKQRTGSPLSRSELLGKMSFVPVERTQLLELQAEGESAGEAQTLANTWANVLRQRENQRFKSGEGAARAFVTEAAARPTDPEKPNYPLYLGVGALLAALLGVLAVLLRERFDHRLMVDPDQDVVLGAPVLGRIPDLADEEAASNAFGLLRANIDFTTGKAGTSVAVTSAGQFEGKTTIAARLALAAVAAGERTIVVEGDVRRPQLDDTALGNGLPKSRTGLTSYLMGTAQISDVILTHERLPGLDVIRAGPLPPNPPAFLRPEKLDRLLEQLSSRYQRVIFDTSPITVAADASLIAAQVDGVIFVVDLGSTNRGDAETGLGQLRKAHAGVLGIVLNRAPVALQSYYRETTPAGR